MNTTCDTLAMSVKQYEPVRCNPIVCTELVGMIGEIDVHLRTEAWDFTHMWSKMYANKKTKQAALSAARTLLLGTPCICHTA